MSPAVVGSLARRGLEVYNRQTTDVEMPNWAWAMFGVTFFIYAFFSSALEYTFFRLIPTLVMIESPPEDILFEPLATEDTDASLNKTNKAAAELQNVKPKPITASFRTTLQMLKAKGGFRSRFRGFSIFVVNQLAVQWAAQTLLVIPFVPRVAAGVVAAVACAQLSLAWTLIVISEPSPKMWFRRLPSIKMWNKVAIPTAILALAEQATVLVPLFFMTVFGVTDHFHQPDSKVGNDKALRNFEDLTGNDVILLGGALTAALFLSCLVSIFLVFPANVALTRVQASLLADAEETVVPFDRSFNGKVIPEIVGGSGVLGMLDAWKTFDWSARIRLVKAYAKALLIQVAVMLLFTIVFLGQAGLVLSSVRAARRENSDAAPEHGALF